MPDGTPTPAQGQAQPATPPFGTTSAVSPTANRGHEAAGLQALGIAVQQLQKIVPLVQPGSDVGQAVLDAIKKLAKFVPAGSVTPASQRNQLEQMAMRQGQENQQLAALKQMQNPQQGQGQQAMQGMRAA
jgi:hypothetical protein